MENRYSFINIQEKLKSIAQVSGSSGVIFHETNQLMAFPEELQRALSERIEQGDEIKVQDFIEANQSTKTIALQSGELIFIDPSDSVAESTLRFLGDQLEEEIQLTIIFDHIFQASLTISSNLNLKELLHKVMSLTEDLLKNEVSSVMLIDPAKEKLYWEVSRGDKSEFFEGKQILPIGKGIAGNVAVTGEAILLNDVREDQRWDNTFDKLCGFHTRSLMCVPITFHGEILGTIEAINKNVGDFTFQDLRILEIIAMQTGAAIENARIHGQLEEAFEELKLLDKAKERVITHLSHELKTPLSIISSVFERIDMLSNSKSDGSIDKALARGQRNVNRLFDLQNKIDDILTQRVVDKGEVSIKEIHIKEFLDELCNQAMTAMTGRELEIHRDFEEDIIIKVDEDVLNKSFLGLLKNAIENTPDEGRVDVTAGIKNGGVFIDVHDYGVGITKENQKLIFGGFFHTQESGSYSTKNPYAFNAGGAGADLLRIKSFSERYGFSVNFESTRCRLIPTDSHKCAGKISACEFIKERSECLSSGGSRFSLIFPLIRPHNSFPF